MKITVYRAIICKCKIFVNSQYESYIFDVCVVIKTLNQLSWRTLRINECEMDENLIIIQFDKLIAVITFLFTKTQLNEETLNKLKADFFTKSR